MIRMVTLIFTLLNEVFVGFGYCRVFFYERDPMTGVSWPSKPLWGYVVREQWWGPGKAHLSITVPGKGNYKIVNAAIRMTNNHHIFLLDEGQATP